MLKEFKKIYKNKKIFVTGHTGFKGSWLIKILNILGAEIKGYALPPESENALYNLINGDSFTQSVVGDLRDRELLKKEIQTFQPDFIFHLAAQPLVKLSYEISYETFDVNAMGTASLLEAVKELRNPCSIILITTDKVYYNLEWQYPYRENDRLGGYDPYSASKACAELIIDSYRNSFFNVSTHSKHQKAIAVTRAGNVIGGGDWAKDRLIPDIIRSLIAKQVIPIRNPNAVRPWQHVLEPLSGYLLLGAKLAAEPTKYSQAYNFGPPNTDNLPVLDIVSSAVEFWGSGEFSILKMENAVHEAGLLRLDISKAQTELSWKPRFNSTQALQQTIAWYKSYAQDCANIDSFTENQIISFFND